MCFGDLFCIPGLVLFVGIVAIVCIAVYIFFTARNPEGSDDVVSIPSGKPYQEDETVEEDLPLIKVNDQILYEELDGLSCFLVVSEVDEEESNVYGYFKVVLPQGTVVEDATIEVDEGITVKYWVTDDLKVTFFDISTDPDELDGYSVYAQTVITDNQN